MNSYYDMKISHGEFTFVFKSRTAKIKYDIVVRNSVKNLASLEIAAAKIMVGFEWPVLYKNFNS